MSTPPLLIELASRTPCIERVALYVAQEVEPTIDVDGTLAALDELAEPLVAAAHGATAPADQAALLAEHLGKRLGLRGNTDDYYDPENSFLDRILVRKTGIPITLSIVYAAIGRRVGFTVEGVGFPGHFFVRVGGPEGVYQDPFHGGRILYDDDLRELASRFLGPDAPVRTPHLAVVDAPTIAMRMLANLQSAYARRRMPARALVAADRLFRLTGDVGFRRDRGIHAYAAGAASLAIEDLEAYVAERPSAPDVERVRSLVARARADHSGDGGAN